mmetsp:Transcript_19883/g.44234  ORF Transcript_19883/g.44234 Transcript_19883/m.44234 type:complete len:271 (+) Transcript_19883:343-1155(+)
MVPQHQLTTLISDHHRTRVGIPRHYKGHDGGVGDPEALDAFDAQVGVADDVGVAGVPHFGAAAVVPGGVSGAEDVLTEGLVAGGRELLDGVGQTINLHRADPLLHAWGKENLSNNLDGLQHAVHVLLVPQQGIIDQRVVPDVARSKPHGAPALLPGVVELAHHPDGPLDLRLHHGGDQELGAAVDQVPHRLQPGVGVELGEFSLELAHQGLHRVAQRVQARQEHQFQIRSGIHPVPLVPLLVLAALRERHSVQTGAVQAAGELFHSLRRG